MNGGFGMRHESNLSKATRLYGANSWPLIGFIVISLFTMFTLVGPFYAYLVIHVAYGSRAWNSGLRPIDNKGHLSDGRDLPGITNLVCMFSSYLFWVAICIGFFIVLSCMNVWFHGKRLRDLSDDRH